MYINRHEKKEFGLFRYAVLHSEIKGKLEELRKKHPANLHYETYGKTNNGRDLYLVVLSKDAGAEGLEDYKKTRLSLVNDPGHALKNAGDKRLPIQFNCNCHGNEVSGTDGMFSFIDEFFAGNQWQDILENFIILITICMNPDGRAKGLDILNGRGFDLNREWMTQCQPETRCMIENVLTKYFPAVMVDMHGFMAAVNVLIDGCTPPHNPFFEYDLIGENMIKGCRSVAKIIKDELNLEVDIPALLWDDGWEDYSPIYTPCYHMMFGTIAHTLETNFPSEEGADICRLAAKGTLNFVIENRQDIFANQCLFFQRGVENKPYPDNDLPNFYVIPNSRESQKDLDIVRDTIDILLRNLIQVYVDDDGNYVIPAAQSLRPVIHNMLWDGEDISDKINNCYDTSFYSYPVMRGFQIIRKKTHDGHLSKIERPLPVKEKTEITAREEFLRISCRPMASFKLANALLGQTSVFRLTQDEASGIAGDFIVKNEAAARQTIGSFSDNCDIRVFPHSSPQNFKQISKQRIVCIADSGGIYEALTENGFETTFVPFCELNMGYQIDAQRYDVMIVGGTKQGLWEDQFDDTLGIGFQNSWGLRERGRKEIIEKAKEMNRFVFYNYAGLRMVEALGLGEFKELEQEKPEVDKSMEWTLSVPNGSFQMNPDSSCPVCYGYQDKELFYMVNPMAFEYGGKEAAIHFGKNAFVNGFNKSGNAYDEKIAAFYDLSGQKQFVYFAFDPTFRKYLDRTFPLIFNSVWAF